MLTSAGMFVTEVNRKFQESNQEESSMLSKRMSVAAIALTSTLSLSLFAAEQAPAAKGAEAAKNTASEKAPRLTLVDPLKDFGTVAKGSKLDWAFTVKNTGDGDLQILSANPTCGCTVAEFDKVIKPGQTGKVVAHVDTTNFNGPIQKAVNLSTNDPNNPGAQLTINAVVKPYVDAFPAGFVRFNLLQGESATQTVKLFSEEEAPFEIINVDAPDHVKVAYRKIENVEERVQGGRPGQTQYVVDLTLNSATAKVGPLADKVFINTNSKFQPQYPISVTGVVRPTYTVVPNALNFGEVTVGSAAATRSVMLRSNSKGDTSAFAVTKVESGLPGVAAEMKATEVPGEYEVTVKLDKNAKAGELNGAVKIFTSDKNLPVYELPVRGLVKPTA
jgi:hypothetical protein